MIRLLNFIFTGLLICIFIFWAPAEVRSAMMAGTAVSVLFCGAAFLLGLLTLDGAVSAIILGGITFGLGGWPTVIALLSFFVSSALISQNRSDDKSALVRRNGRQVWANGFWLVCWLMVALIVHRQGYGLAAFAAIATATADTWATEMGSRRFKASTYLASTWQAVPAGTEGGVSWPGLAASLAGSGLMALIYYLGFPVSAGAFFAVLAAGMAGSLIDSYLGATLQGHVYPIHLFSAPSAQKVTVDNNMVNWLATGFASFLILILNVIIL